IWNHVLFDDDGPAPVVDPWAALAAIALHAERICLGAMITRLASWRPWKVAREIVSIDHPLGGRLIFGDALGVPHETEFGACGEEVDQRARARKLDDGLEILAGLWTAQLSEHLREIVAHVARHRRAAGPSDVAIHGCSELADAERQVEPYVDADLTWRL